MKKIIALSLSVILFSMSVFAVSPKELSAYGQKEVTSNYTYTRPVQDGEISPNEYGVTFADTVNMSSKAVTVTESAKAYAPEFINVYTTYDDETIYFAVEVKEAAHANNQYKLTAKLGFNNGNSSWEANSLVRNDYLYDQYKNTEVGTAVWTVREDFTTKMNGYSSIAYNALGNVVSSSRRWTQHENPCAYCAQPTTKHANGTTVFEFTFDLHDAITGAKKWDGKIPEQGYFEFEYHVYNGSTDVGTVAYRTNIESTQAYTDFETEFGASSLSVPHVIKLVKNYVVGDVDGSGKVDSRDAAILARHIAKWTGYETLPYTK